ncbi:glycosyltransferase family 2 protein [candidate division CSSED10-310 bacterium]|uniref:Glycosyltransferase family 2 protein n=1 Tax=candidate division CSSED10-310 bacterium TaxID=2855610 RepID=A0ABV6Z0X9_UNCC1
MPTLSLVIITWNQCARLEHCLHSIFSSDNSQQDIEVIIIDNNSADGTLSMLDQFSSLLTLIKNDTNRGVAPARNQGIALAAGKYIMMLDDDTEVKPLCFQKIIAFMDRNEDCWCLGTKTLKPDQTIELNARTFYDIPTIIARRTPLGKLMKDTVNRHLMCDWDHNSAREVDWVAGASFVMRAEAIEKIGVLDEKYFFGFEDVDWCYRIRLARKKVYYLHDAKIVHHVQGSSRRLFSKKAFYHLLSAIRFYRKFNYLRQPGR